MCCYCCCCWHAPYGIPKCCAFSCAVRGTSASKQRTLRLLSSATARPSRRIAPTTSSSETGGQYLQPISLLCHPTSLGGTPIVLLWCVDVRFGSKGPLERSIWYKPLYLRSVLTMVDSCPPGGRQGTDILFSTSAARTDTFRGVPYRIPSTVY